LEGVLEGDLEGVLEGDFDGDFEGVRVGDLEGDLEGRDVVGDRDGDLDGVFVGDLDGDDVGTVGCSVGARVGMPRIGSSCSLRDTLGIGRGPAREVLASAAWRARIATSVAPASASARSRATTSARRVVRQARWGAILG